MAKTSAKDKEIRAACSAAGLSDPAHHEAAVKASAAGVNVLALLQTLVAALNGPLGAEIWAMVQALLNAHKPPAAS